jgi:hypothetical protein
MKSAGSAAFEQNFVKSAQELPGSLRGFRASAIRFAPEQVIFVRNIQGR